MLKLAAPIQISGAFGQSHEIVEVSAGCRPLRLQLLAAVLPISLLRVLVLCYKGKLLYFCGPYSSVKNTSTHNLRLLCSLR